jgi:hypothetical protein
MLLAWVSLLVVGCSTEADKKLEATKAAHSIAAEMATVEQLAGQSRVNSIYVKQMRGDAQSQLATLRKQFAPDEEQGRLIDALTANPSAEQLGQASNRLDALEKQLELR